MCDCGCGQFTADFQFPGPNGSTYLLALCSPCGECETPVGLILQHAESKAALETLGAAHAKPLTWEPWGGDVDRGGWKERAIPLVSPGALLTTLREELADELDLNDSTDVARALIGAMRATIEKWEKAVAASVPRKRKRGTRKGPE